MLQRSILRMDSVMNFSQALQALLSLRFRGSRPVAPPDIQPDLAPDDRALAGASFVSLEPALSQELHLTGEDISGWAMGGSSLSD